MTLDTYIKMLFEQEGYVLDNEQSKAVTWGARYFEGYAEHLCNTPEDHPQHIWFKNLHDEFLAKLRAMVVLKMIPDFKVSYDPRGYALRFFFKSGISNTWGGKEEGFGIVTQQNWVDQKKDFIRYLK